jgi:sugar lactone lactonase YvrE
MSCVSNAGFARRRCAASSEENLASIALSTVRSRSANPAGELLGKVHIPETVANLCFGGMFRNRLYICGSTSLYAVYTSATGAMKP